MQIDCIQMPLPVSDSNRANSLRSLSQRTSAFTVQCLENNLID